MNSRKRLVLPTLFILSFVALVMKKLMVPFHGLFLIILFDAIAIFYLLQVIKFEKNVAAIPGRTFKFDISSIVFAVCSIAILYRLQYHEGWESWMYIAGILFLVISVLTFFSIISFWRAHKGRNKIKMLMWGNLSWIYFLILFPTVSLTSPRTFHNLFNGTTYEEYVRSRYPMGEGTLLLEKYKSYDSESKACAKKYLNDAHQSEKSEDYESALEFYNRSIDLDPDNAIAIYNRGRLKLTHLELSKDMAQSAYNDFCRSLELQPKSAVALYFRAISHNYLFPKDLLPTRTDLIAAKTLDTSLIHDSFINNFLAHSMDDSIDSTTSTPDSSRLN